MDFLNIYPSALFLILYSFVDARVMEKTELVCNGPCGRMSLTCPSGHRVAIRDAVYRVQEKVDTCTSFTGCGHSTQDVCCEPTPDDCVFAFSPSHLRAAQRNCSYVPGCELQTERSEVESVQCSASDPASQTLVNYVCVNESVVTNICSPQERVVQGRTLFALLNPQGPDKPHQGSVCTCLAESTKWPTTNSIAAFIVDMRLNRVDSEQCANTSMTVRSGSNQKTLTCATSRDPRVNFPFVAVLNDSNVASLRLQLDRHMPEFIWLGFEANEEEDIRLSCKLQGVQPTRPNAGRGPPRHNERNQKVTPAPVIPPGKNQEGAGGTKPAETSMQKKKSKLPLAAMIGAALAGVLAIVILIIIIVVVKRRWKSDGGLPEAEEDESELDLYYSTTASELQTREDESELDLYYSTTASELQTREASKHEKRPSKSSTDSRQELYISADQVRANKRTASSKRVRIISTPDIVEDLGPQQYVSRAQIRENKRQSQKKKQLNPAGCDLTDQFPNPGAAQLCPPIVTSDIDEEEDDDHYDKLHRPQKNMAAILESYDQLEPSRNSVHQTDYSSAEVRVQRSDSTRPIVEPSGGKHISKEGNDNGAYEFTDIKETHGDHKPLFRINPPSSKDATEDKDVYFELEKERSSRHSIASESSVSNPFHQAVFEASASPMEEMLTNSRASDQSLKSSSSEASAALPEPMTLPVRGVSLDVLCENLAEERRRRPKENEEEEIYNDGRSEFSPTQLRMSSSETDPQPSPSSKPIKRVRASVASIGVPASGTPVAAPRRKASLGPEPPSANYDLAKPIP